MMAMVLEGSRVPTASFTGLPLGAPCGIFEDGTALFLEAGDRQLILIEPSKGFGQWFMDN